MISGLASASRRDDSRWAKAPEPPVEHAIVAPKILLEQVQNGSRLLHRLAGLVNRFSTADAPPVAKILDRLLKLPGHHASERAGGWPPAFQPDCHVPDRLSFLQRQQSVKECR
jgi:hypothetical protein